MGKHGREKRPERQVQVTNRHTGESRLVDAPVGKLSVDRVAGESDSMATGITTPVVEEPPVPADKVAESGGRADDKGADREEKSKKKKLESCDEYLEAYYAGKIKSLNDETIHSIGAKSAVSNVRHAQMVDDALRSDFTLDKTRQLLVLSLNAGRFSGLAKSLRDFARDVVFRHPGMASQQRDSWFPSISHNDSSNIKSIWEDFVKTSAKVTSDAAEDEDGRDKKTNASDIQRARRNAFLCANVWRYAEQQTNFTEFVRSLRATVYQSTSEAKDIEASVIALLVSAQDKAQAGIADFARWYHDQTIHVQNQSELNRQRLESLQISKTEVDELLLAREQEVAKLTEQLRGLQEQLQASEEVVRVLKVHSKDDLERQSSRTIRALEDEIPVLTDCLTALNRDPPKVEVAKEYLGAALDTLNNELKILREK